MGGFSLWHWLIVLVIVVLVFGTKRLKNVGQDLGEAIRGFKKGVKDGDDKPADGRDPDRPAAQLQDESRPVAPAPPAEPTAVRGDRPAPRDDDDRTAR